MQTLPQTILKRGIGIQRIKVKDVKPNTWLQSLFRALAVGRGVLCVGLPGTVGLYWLTSTTISLFESIMFQLIEQSRYPKHWGRNSRLLLLPRDQLIEQGVNLSPVPPLERAGLKNYSKMKNGQSQQHNKIERAATKALLTGLNGATAASEGAVKLAGSAKSRTMASIAWTKERAHDTVASIDELKDGAIDYVVPKYEKLKNLDGKDVRKFRTEVGSKWDTWKWSRVREIEEWLKHSRKDEIPNTRVKLTPEELARRQKKKKQWLYVLGAMNKEKAKEAKKQAKEYAAQQERERSIPGLQPPRWQPPEQDAANKQPLFR